MDLSITGFPSVAWGEWLICPLPALGTGWVGGGFAPGHAFTLLFVPVVHPSVRLHSYLKMAYIMHVLLSHICH